MTNKRYDKISTYFKDHKLLLLGLCLSGLCFDGLMAFIPLMLGKLIEAFSSSLIQDTLIKQALLFLFLVLFVQINRFFKRFFVRIFANKITYTMRKISFSYLINQSQDFYKDKSKGYILSRNVNDINDTAEGIRKLSTEFFDTFILLIGYLTSMIIYDYALTLIILAFVFLSLLISLLLRKLVYLSSLNYKKYLSLSKDQTLTSLRNEFYYRGLGCSKYYHSSYKKTQEELSLRAQKSLFLKTGFEPLYHAIIFLSLVFVIYYCSLRVVEGTWLISSFTAFLTTYMMVATKASRLGKVVNAYQGFKVSWIRCKPFLKEVNFNERKYEKLIKSLNVNKLSVNVLHDISFSATKGEIIGVCGKVHTGKTTLLEAISGNIEYEGNIKVDDKELSKLIKENNYIDLLGYCSSRSEIFTDSINNNITLNHNGSSEEASEIAEIKKEVDSRNKGEEIISSSLANLSGGQQKRLMIARAVFSSPQIILLDNPFESVDESSALKIIQNLREKRKESIIIITSNQESILKKCDKLLYIKEDSFIFDSFINISGNPEFINFIEGVNL